MNFGIVLTLCNLTTFVLSILAIIHTVRLRKLRSIRWLLVLSACFLVSSFCSVLVDISEGFDEKVRFFHLRVLAMLFVAPSWLYFLNSVFDRWNWLNKRWVIGIILAPCTLNFLIALFPSTFPLLFTEFEPTVFHGVTVAKFKTGRLYDFFYMWSVLLFLLSYVLSAITFAKEHGYRRRQVLILNLGIGAALVSRFFAENPFLGYVVSSSLSLLLTQVGVMYAVIRHRLLSVVPLAMERIFKKLPDPVLVIDDRKRLMGASDKAVSFFGLPEDFLGQPIEKILPTVPHSPGEQILTDCFGRPHAFHLALERIGSETESSPGTVLFFRDIGAQNEGLEFRARLLALLAHDLTGFLESQVLLSLALQKSAGPELFQQFELLSNSASSAQELVGNIMSWVKTQTMRFQPEKRAFEWNVLLRETIELLQSRLTIKGVEAVYVSTQHPILAEGDSEMLASVFRNILSNAVRSTPQGKKIYVSLEVAHGNAEVKVRDEGCGIDSAKLEMIRESSKDFLLSRASKTQGSGIGLMIARNFISLHQGHFQISSSPGIGTEVSFSIPL